MAPGHARQVVARGNATEKAPSTFAAWADGRLSTGQARHVFALAENVPDSFPDAEERLVDIVEGLTVSDTRKAIEYWRQSVHGPGELDPEIQFARRGLSSSKTLGGMRYVSGWLTPTAGEVFDTAMNAAMDPPADDDTRTPRQRRAIIARDRHCQGPGCERDPRWCDIHHVDHWADGGETSIDKGVLLCRACHTIEHHKQAARRRRERHRT